MKNRKKSRKILAILLSAAMLCSSLPVYAQGDNASSQPSEYTTSQFVSSDEGTEAIQNDESISQTESDTSVETSGEESANNEDDAQVAENNTNAQNTEDSQSKVETTESSAYYLEEDVQSLVNMDLSQGSITISKSDDVISLEQNGQTTMMPPAEENIIISQSGDKTGNNITIKGSVNAAQPIMLENLNIICVHPIVVEEGADVNFIFRNNNRLEATSKAQDIDYPAIEVPQGATVTLSGDGSLEAIADGYAAAIGTKGHYCELKEHSDVDKSSGTVQIDGTLNVKAHSAFGAGIGGGAIQDIDTFIHHAFNNGTVIIKGNAVVEALGSTEGGYSAGIGGGGCQSFMNKRMSIRCYGAYGGDGGDVQILDNAQVTAACKGTLGAGIGGGGGNADKWSEAGYGGNGKSFKADNNAVVVATGANYGPGIGGGGAQQEYCSNTYPGNSGSCSVLGSSNVTAQSGGNAANFGYGGHAGNIFCNYDGDYTEPVVDPTATFHYMELPLDNMDLSLGSIKLSQDFHTTIVEQNGIETRIWKGHNIKITQSSSEPTTNRIAIEQEVKGQSITLENLNIICESPISVGGPSGTKKDELVGVTGASVNLIFHKHNRVEATNKGQARDYPAIKVGQGATVTLSGDGSLEAISDGYGAAIGAIGCGCPTPSWLDKSGKLYIKDSLNVKAYSAFGAGIGGGAFYNTVSDNGRYCNSGSGNGIVIIEDNAVVEAFGSMEGGYSAGIGGGGGCAKIFAAGGGKGGKVEILDNAQVTAACKGSLGAGIGGGGAYSKTYDSVAGDGASFKADGNAVVYATGGEYAPGIGGGSAKQDTCCSTFSGSSGTCNVLGYSTVTALSGGNTDGYGTGTHVGGWFHSYSSYTDPVIDPTATLKDVCSEQQSINMDLSQGSITISQRYSMIAVEQNGIEQVVHYGNNNIMITQSSSKTTYNITIKGSMNCAQQINLENLKINCEHPIVVEKGADVNFIFHNNNTLTGSNCKMSTDYPAIEVPEGTTVTLSGDGSLEAVADGYAAAIGTKGYYRDGLDHGDSDKSSGTIQIEDSLNVKAHSAYGAGIGGGAISGSACEQHAFDNGTVIIKGNAVVEALGSTEGSYSAGIGGGGCYTSSCAAVGGDGGDVQILDNAQVTAACKGTLGAGIGGGGGCGKTADGFGGDGESFKSNDTAVVVATGANYGPGIGGGGAQQKTCCATHTGNSGSCSVFGRSNVTAQGGEHAENFGIGGHTGGWVNYKGDYTEPAVSSIATFIK